MIDNTNPDAIRIQELSNEIHNILEKNGWPGVILLIAKDTPETIVDIANVHINLEDKCQIEMMEASDIGQLLVDVMSNIDLEN